MFAVLSHCAAHRRRQYELEECIRKRKIRSDSRYPHQENVERMQCTQAFVVTASIPRICMSS